MEKNKQGLMSRKQILKRKSSEFKSENIYAVSIEPLEQCENCQRTERSECVLEVFSIPQIIWREGIKEMGARRR